MFFLFLGYFDFTLLKWTALGHNFQKHNCGTKMTEYILFWGKMKRRSGIPSILDTWKEQFLTLFPLDEKRIFSDDDEMKQIIIMSRKEMQWQFSFIKFFISNNASKKIVKTIKAKFQNFSSTLIYFKKICIPTCWFSRVMNNPIAVSGFEPSLLQICQWLCPTDLHIFMVDRIRIVRCVNLSSLKVDWRTL